MSYNEALAERIQSRLGSMPGIKAKKMFGGIGFLLNGNMAVGVIDQSMIVRIPAEQTAQTLEQQHTRVFDLTGKPMKGWVLVEMEGVAEEDDLDAWIKRGVDYAASLPPK
jgi:TfoX/Sxy family transcriptional regulator of competence genes